MYMTFRTQSPVRISNSQWFKKSISQIFQKIDTRTFFNSTADHISIEITVQPLSSWFIYNLRIFKEISDPVRRCITFRPVTEKQRAFQTGSHCQHIFQSHITKISFCFLRSIFRKNINDLLIQMNQSLIQCNSHCTGYHAFACRPGIQTGFHRHSLIFCR